MDPTRPNAPTAPALNAPVSPPSDPQRQIPAEQDNADSRTVDKTTVTLRDYLDAKFHEVNENLQDIRRRVDDIARQADRHAERITRLEGRSDGYDRHLTDMRQAHQTLVEDVKRIAVWALGIATTTGLALIGWLLVNLVDSVLP